jgi:hypothetical protein
MPSMRRLDLLCIAFGVVLPVALVAQGPPADEIGGPFSREAVTNAPFSADVITAVCRTRPDGTRVDEQVTGRYYRDSAGRVRVEQTVPDAPAGNAGRQTFVVIDPQPGDSRAYILDATARDIRIIPRSAVAEVFNGGNSIGVPRSTGSFDVFRPRGWADIDTETSEELKIVARSRYSDSRRGEIEYHLTNIDRGEPAADLFVVPSGYRLTTQADARPWFGVRWPIAAEDHAQFAK